MAKAKQSPICDPLNFCIYCGEADIKLTNEHIFPAGLDGVSTLPAASCQTCQNITSRFERSVLRGGMHLQRMSQGSFTRRPQQQPTHTMISLNEHQIQIPISEHPALLHLYIFPPPTIETGIYTLTNGVQISGLDSVINPNKLDYLYMHYLHPSLTPEQKSDIQKNGLTFSEKTTYGQFETQSFIQLIAKIALCCSFSVFGSNFLQRNFLKPLILGSSEHFNYLIGSHVGGIEYQYQVALSESEPHCAYLSIENGYLVAYIQPYSKTRFQSAKFPPTYKVFVCNYSSLLRS